MRINLKNRLLAHIAILISVVFISGCSTKYASDPSTQLPVNDKIVLQEGDVIKITFPDAPNLNTTTKIRRDGTISLPDVGELHVVGLTSTEVEKLLLAKYADQIVSKEINVSIEVSNFEVYVTGAVMHPGKVASDRPLTALEAVLEAGGVDFSRANLKNVVISRNINGRLQHFQVDLKKVLNGQSGDTFNLRPNDILYIPEKFAWF